MRSYGCSSVAARALFALAVLLFADGVRAQPEADAAREAAMVRFTIGVYLLESGQASDAIALLEAAWRDSGRNPVVGVRLAQAHYAVRDLEKADRIAGEVLAADPGRTDMLHMKARLSLARGDLKGAIALLEKARAIRPNSLETERMLAGLYAETGDIDRALRSLERCIEIDPGLSDLRVSYGEALFDAGEPDRAEAAFREALELDPLDARAVDNLHALYTQEGRASEALAVLENYAANPGAPWEARMGLARAYADAGRFDDAARVLEEDRGEGPRSDEESLLLGRVYFEAGRFEDARKVFDALYRQAGNSPELARIMGDISLKTGDAKAARGYFDNAIAWGPDDYRSYLAIFFAGSDRFSREDARLELSAEEKSGFLAKASQLAPDTDYDAQFAVGMACSSVDSLEMARDHLALANRLKPGQQPVMFNLASVYEKLGRYRDAEDVLEVLLEIAPDDAAVLNFYGYLLSLMNKDLDRAEKMVRRALEKEPGNAFYIDSLGWVYYQRGEYEKAVTELERAVRIAGDDPVILEHLGDAYSQLSRYRDALAVYQQSSRLQETNSKLREKIESTQRRLR